MTFPTLPSHLNSGTYVSSYASALIANAQSHDPSPLSLEAQCKRTVLFSPVDGPHPYPLITQSSTVPKNDSALLEIFASRITNAPAGSRSKRSQRFLTSLAPKSTALREQATALETTLFTVGKKTTCPMKSIHKARNVSLVALRYLMNRCDNDSLRDLNFTLSAKHGHLSALEISLNLMSKFEQVELSELQQKQLDLEQKQLDEALSLSAKGGHRSCMERLVEAGANVNYTDKHRHSALSHAASGRHLEAVQYLLSLEETVVDQLDTQNRTPLMHAACLLESSDPVEHTANLEKRTAVWNALTADHRCDRSLRDVKRKSAADMLML